MLQNLIRQLEVSPHARSKEISIGHDKNSKDPILKKNIYVVIPMLN
jgi:hypothetical protein